MLGNRLYIATSSSGGGAARQIFRGSMIALDIRTGRIIWQTFVLPDNGGVPGGFAGGAFVNPPAIDVENGLVFGAAGQLYTQPASVTACLDGRPGRLGRRMLSRRRLLQLGDRVRSAHRRSRGGRSAAPGPMRGGSGAARSRRPWCPPWRTSASGISPAPARTCFARASTDAGATSSASARRAACTGRSTRAPESLLWSTLVGHGDDPGGIQWGTAVDGKRIYAAIGHNTDASAVHAAVGRDDHGRVVGGARSIDRSRSSGRHRIRRARPDLAALTVANGVLYAGSMAHTGDQMYALNAATGDDSVALRRRRLGRRGPCRRGRHRLLGIRLRADRRRRQRQVLRVQHRRAIEIRSGDHV